MDARGHRRARSRNRDGGLERQRACGPGLGSAPQRAPVQADRGPCGAPDANPRVDPGSGGGGAAAGRAHARRSQGSRPGHRAGAGRARADGHPLHTRRVLQRPRRTGAVPHRAPVHRCVVACRRRGGQRRRLRSRARRVGRSRRGGDPEIDRTGRGAAGSGWSAERGHRRRDRGRVHRPGRVAPADAVPVGAQWLERVAEGSGSEGQAREGDGSCSIDQRSGVVARKAGRRRDGRAAAAGRCRSRSLQQGQGGLHERLRRLPSA